MNKRGIISIVLLLLLALSVHATTYNYYRNPLIGNSVLSARWESPNLALNTSYNLSRKQQPAESTIIYTGQSCDTRLYVAYFNAQNNLCRFSTSDNQKNSWSCAGYSSLQCKGSKCPQRACRTPGRRAVT